MAATISMSHGFEAPADSLKSENNKERNLIVKTMAMRSSNDRSSGCMGRNSDSVPLR